MNGIDVGKKRGSYKHRRPEERLDVRAATPRGENREPWPPGYYIFVLRQGRNWRPLLIRFARRRDADLGRAALLREGISTFTQLKNAGNARVRQIIGEAMQW